MSDLDEVKKLILELGDRLAQVERAMRAHGVKLDNLECSTRGVVELWGDSQAAFKMFTKVAEGIRWVIKFFVIPVLVLLVLFEMIFHPGDESLLSRMIIVLKGFLL